MTEIKSRDILVQTIKKYEGWIIYGAGVIGQGLFCLLKMLGLENRVLGFAVSDHTDHLDEFMDVPIKNISEYHMERNRYPVIIAVKRIYLNEISLQLGNTECCYADLRALKEIFEQDSSAVVDKWKAAMDKADLTDEQYVTFCIRQIRRTRLDFEVNIADHCNLNCQCCNHFSPLAGEVFLDIGTFQKDLARIAELTAGNAGKIWLIGGEPLLHPQVADFMYIARELFPAAHITLNTNGMLLAGKKADFWQALRDTGTELTLTKYPVAVDYDGINRKMDSENVKYAYTLSSSVLKTTYHLPLDVEGKLDGVKNYLKCWHANECITLRNGAIYTCPIAAHAHYFNEYFGSNLYTGRKNFISIYEAENVEQILEFLKKPIPFCRHCNIDGYRYGLEWKTSRKDVREWT